ncbi:gluconate kinase [Pedobacter sp. Leaf41]|jgi:gluconokinase|uniref:gluconokinase n=1 Tax=Pedobacter sp. Leaf41 TaxID=1736218 RepID=UPI00070241F0|nr:gluconokinase [Pedobacter sp. Leaf41]KQN28622.1 gluconate kinase [Pedobacter sp. Leaf41]RZK68006.1 MAG: gluconokinase [Pedobacter sp.]
MARFIILMGVSGSGKTVIGKSLAPNLNAEFIDGDNLHTQRNVDKMAAGIPLTDEDRLDWLNLIAKVGHDHAEHGTTCIIACSALKRKYRDILRATNPKMGFIYLKGSYELIFDRISKRSHQYMPSSLLQSQFDTLEEPQADEKDVFVVSIDQEVSEIVDDIVKAGLVE